MICWLYTLPTSTSWRAGSCPPQAPPVSTSTTQGFRNESGIKWAFRMGARWLWTESDWKILIFFLCFFPCLPFLLMTEVRCGKRNLPVTRLSGSQQAPRERRRRAGGSGLTLAPRCSGGPRWRWGHWGASGDGRVPHTMQENTETSQSTRLRAKTHTRKDTPQAAKGRDLHNLVFSAEKHKVLLGLFGCSGPNKVNNFEEPSYL